MLLRPILATVRYLPCSITGFFLNVRAPKSYPLSSLRLDADVDPSPPRPPACPPAQLIVAILASRVPAQVLITIGALGTGLAPLLFAVQDYSDPYWQWQFPAMILSVFGADFIL